MNKTKEVTIIRDTREKDGWNFESEEKKPGKVRVVGTQISTLSTGDYSILGFEDQFLIERKNSILELFGNYTPVEHKQRFERELERMKNVKYKYLIIEGNLSKDLWGMSIQQFRFPIPASRILEWVEELSITYGIQVRYAGDCGKKLFRRLVELFVKEKNNETTIN